MTGRGARKGLWSSRLRGSSSDITQPKRLCEYPQLTLGVLIQSREVGVLPGSRRGGGQRRDSGKNEQNACRNSPPELL